MREIGASMVKFERMCNMIDVSLWEAFTWLGTFLLSLWMSMFYDYDMYETYYRQCLIHGFLFCLGFNQENW